MIDFLRASGDVLRFGKTRRFSVKLDELGALHDDGSRGECIELSTTPSYVDAIAIEAALTHLRPKLLHVIRELYYEGLTGGEVALAMGVSEGRVSHLRTEALNVLWRALAPKS